MPKDRYKYKPIIPKKITKKQALHILKLLRQETQAEVMARLGVMSSSEWGDAFEAKLDKLDEIRRFVFGTDDLHVLGIRWGLPLHGKIVKKKKRKKNAS